MEVCLKKTVDKIKNQIYGIVEESTVDTFKSPLPVRLVDCGVYGRHGLPALPVQREQQVRHQADQLQLLYLRDPA